LPDRIEELVRALLAELDDEPRREGLARTPERVAQSLRFLTSGRGRSVGEILNGAVFEQRCDEIILVKDIEVYSLCEHHLLPFVGKAQVAYLPKGRVLGLSKIARLVDFFARRLQIQERLTEQIAKAIEQATEPAGVGVIVEAAHFCMMMRGVEKQNSVAVTSCMLGRFRSDPKTRSEFLTLVYGRRGASPLP
jgi:GTP cyclohydrolase I